MPSTVQLQHAGQVVSIDNPVPVVTRAPAASSANKATMVQGVKAPAATGTPEPLTAVETLVHSVRIKAARAGRVANTGSVWLGYTATNDAQLWELVPTEWISITAPPGKVLDLALIYVDSVTLTDGVIFQGEL